MADNHRVQEDASGTLFRSTETAGVKAPHVAVAKPDGDPLALNSGDVDADTLRVAIGNQNIAPLTALDTIIELVAVNFAANSGGTPSVNYAIADLLRAIAELLRIQYQAISSTLLNAVSAVGAGSGVDVRAFREFTFYFVASSVTSGGTVTIEALMPDNTTWVTLHSQPITANTATTQIAPVYFRGVFNQIRANLVARTDGTFTASMLAGA